ncbi:MAG: hypothetical protein AB8B54_09620 [Sphingorhabdus sp.]
MTLLKASLIGQVFWVLSASAYNLLSLRAIGRGELGFAGDAATTQSAMIAVVIFGAVTLLGIFGRKTLYKIMVPIVAVALFVGGVMKHVHLGPADYASQQCWIAAIAINCFGVAAYLVGAFTAFRKH